MPEHAKQMSVSVYSLPDITGQCNSMPSTGYLRVCTSLLETLLQTQRISLPQVKAEPSAHKIIINLAAFMHNFIQIHFTSP